MTRSKPLAAILAVLLLASPALAQPPTVPPLPTGRLLLLGPAPHAARFLAIDQSGRRPGGLADVWVYFVYVPPMKFGRVSVAQALLHQTFDCSHHIATELGWTDYDEAGRFVTRLPGSPSHPIKPGSPEEAAEKDICFGLRPTEIRAILGHANAYRAAHLVLAPGR